MIKVYVLSCGGDVYNPHGSQASFRVHSVYTTLSLAQEAGFQQAAEDSDYGPGPGSYDNGVSWPEDFRGWSVDKKGAYHALLVSSAGAHKYLIEEKDCQAIL